MQRQVWAAAAVLVNAAAGCGTSDSDTAGGLRADFERLYRRRNDAESINRHFDDTLWLRRAHSVGHLRQTLNLLTYALGINALAVHLHRERHSPPRAA